MEYKGYEGLTQAQIKEKIIVEFYTKGTADGKKQPKMEFKKHIGFAVSKMYGFDEGTATDLGEDLFQIVFEELWKYTPEKFCNTFFKEDGEFDSSRFFGTLGNILNWQGLSKTSGLMKKIMRGSALDSANLSFDVDANDNENYANLESLLLVADNEYIEKISVDEILSYLNEDEMMIWNEKLLKPKFRDEFDSYAWLKLKKKIFDIRTQFKLEIITGAKKVKKFHTRKPSIEELHYKKLYKTGATEDGKVRYIRLEEHILNFETEIETLKFQGNEVTRLFNTTSKMLQLLYDDRDLTKVHRTLSSQIGILKHKHSSESIGKIRSELNDIVAKKTAIKAQLMELEDERKEIILSKVSEYIPIRKKKVVKKPPIKGKKPRYQKLLRWQRFENGKWCTNGIVHWIANVVDEISVLETEKKKGSERYKIAKNMLALLKEDKKLSVERYKHVAIINTHAKSKTEKELSKVQNKLDVLLTRRKQIKEELEKLEDDRKRIIQSDATNGSTV